MAASINATSTNLQALRGLSTTIYYENLNAPSSSTPVTVNTATSMTATSGSYQITSVTSAYLWTPQLSATTIPANNLALNLWASASTSAASPPALDGYAHSSNGATSSQSLMLTTTQANDVIYVTVAVNGNNPTVSTPTAAGLTFQNRGSIAVGTTGKIFAFWAIAPNALTNTQITTTVAPAGYAVMIAFGVSGANTGNPFDTNLSVPATSTGTSSTPSVSFSTANSNDFIIGAAYIF